MEARLPLLQSTRQLESLLTPAETCTLASFLTTAFARSLSQRELSPRMQELEAAVTVEMEVQLLVRRCVRQRVWLSTRQVKLHILHKDRRFLLINLVLVGNVFLADGNNRVRKITSTSIITTVAGTGTASFSGDNGPASSATLYGTIGVALNTEGKHSILATHSVDSSCSHLSCR